MSDYISAHNSVARTTLPAVIHPLSETIEAIIARSRESSTALDQSLSELRAIRTYAKANHIPEADVLGQNSVLPLRRERERRVYGEQ